MNEILATIDQFNRAATENPALLYRLGEQLDAMFDGVDFLDPASPWITFPTVAEKGEGMGHVDLRAEAEAAAVDFFRENDLCGRQTEQLADEQRVRLGYRAGRRKCRYDRAAAVEAWRRICAGGESTYKLETQEDRRLRAEASAKRFLEQAAALVRGSKSLDDVRARLREMGLAK